MGRRSGCRPLLATPVLCLRAGGYPTEHRDPFDRLLAAQSELEGLTLVTRDRVFTQFPAVVFWQASRIRNQGENRLPMSRNSAVNWLTCWARPRRHHQL